MGYVLLWIESLAVSLLWAATMITCIAPLRRRKVLSVLIVLAPLAGYLSLTGLAGFMKYGGMLGTRFYPILALTVFFVIGASWLLHRGLGRGSEEPQRRPALSWPRRKLAIALGVAVVLHLTTFWNLDLAARQWLAAHRAEAGALALSVAPPRVSDRDNAALVYQQAFEVMGPLKSWNEASDFKFDEWARAGETDFDPQEPELREFLQRQTSVLALLRRAAEKPGCYFDRNYGRPGLDFHVSQTLHLMTASRLLALQSRCTAADGHLGAALEDVQALFSMAEHVSNEPVMISVLLSMAIESTAADALQAVLRSGQPSADELAALDVDPSVSYARCFQRAFRMEEALYLSICCHMGLGTLEPGRGMDMRGLAPLYRVFVFNEDMAVLRRTMQELHRLTVLPFHETRDDWQRFNKKLKAGSEGFIGIGNLLTPALTRLVERAVEADARHRVVRVALAMHRYRAAGGRFPDKLEDLTPEFIIAVPRDPFDGKPIKLKRTDGGLVVYSIGPDMTDQGGSTPFDRDKKTGDITFKLAP
jgi:hypothetical protein